ncbi:hypothetical protein ACWD4N_45105, partial [Streptomyces sp. NPDC002586]
MTSCHLRKRAQREPSAGTCAAARSSAVSGPCLPCVEARREKIARWESGKVTPETSAQLAIAHVHQIPP